MIKEKNSIYNKAFHISEIKKTIGVDGFVSGVKKKFNDKNWKLRVLFDYYGYEDESYTEDIARISDSEKWYHYSDYIEGEENLTNIFNPSRSLKEVLPFIDWELTGKVIKIVSYNKDTWKEMEKIATDIELTEEEMLLKILNLTLEREVVFFEGDYDRINRVLKNWLNGFVKENLNKNGFYNARNKKQNPEFFQLDFDRFFDLIMYVEYTDLIDFTTAKDIVFNYLVKNKDKSVYESLLDCGLLNKKSDTEIEEKIKFIISKYPDKVLEYKKGKVGIASMFMGEIMKEFKGKINAKEANEMIINTLNKI